MLYSLYFFISCFHWQLWKWFLPHYFLSIKGHSARHTGAKYIWFKLIYKYLCIASIYTSRYIFSHRNYILRCFSSYYVKKVPQSNMIALLKFKNERMFVFGFFSNSFVTCNKENGSFLWKLFVALSHCNKIFFIVCCTRSLQQMDFLFVALSHCDKQNLHKLLWNIGTKDFLFFSMNTNAVKDIFVCRTESLRQTQFLFVALSHCDKQNLYKLLRNIATKDF